MEGVGKGTSSALKTQVRLPDVSFMEELAGRL